MSQMLTQKPKSSVLYSELAFPRKTIQLKSAAKEVVCYICKSELREGSALTARHVGNKLVLMCGYHKF
jgi:hypothetical protein